MKRIEELGISPAQLTNDNDTVRELCVMASSQSWLSYWHAAGKTIKDFVDMILSAHECEMAAKDTEIARLKAALKPVMECQPLSQNYDECDFITDENCGSGDSWRIADMVNAVREAQRIINEGESEVTND